MRTENSPKNRPRKERSRFTDEYGVLLSQLVDIRKRSGVTQKELARQLGKTQSHISMCELREREISIIDLWKWCNALGTSMADFIREFESAVGNPLKKSQGE